MTFAKEDMIKALEAIGYKIKKEEEMQSVSVYHNQIQEVSQNVYNVYYKDSIVPCATWAGFGLRRVEFVFQQELNKRILGLFE